MSGLKSPKKDASKRVTTPLDDECNKHMEIDESLLKKPIDLHTLKIDTPPDSPSLSDEHDVQDEPFTSIMGIRVHTPSQDKTGIESLRQILDGINIKKEKPKKVTQRLSKNIEPPHVFHFSPEAMYKSRVVGKVLRGSKITDEDSYDLVRKFPPDLYRVSFMNGLKRKTSSSPVPAKLRTFI